MKSKLPTLAVAIPAFNEEGTINLLLSELLNQQLSHFRLQGITVYSDHSTDSTHEVVRTFIKKQKLVKLVIGSTRMGKYFRLNRVFSSTTADVLIVLDADIALSGRHFLEKLATAIIADPKALMVSAHQVVIRPEGFVSRIIYTNFHLWDQVRWSIPNFDNGNNFYASATAFRGTYVRRLKIPTNLTDPHLYLYAHVARRHGFRYCLGAKILQQSISTLTDYHKFLRRPLGKTDLNLEKIFGSNVYEAYTVPVRYKIIGLLKCFRAEPLFTPLALVLGLYGKVYLRYGVKKSTSSLWETVSSTKKQIHNVHS